MILAAILFLLWLVIGAMVRTIIGILIPNWVSYNGTMLVFEIVAWPWTVCVAVRL
jgi:hypothetical protein